MAGALLNPVLLGYPDEEVGPDSNIDYTVSKIGGLPDWIGPDLPLSELTCTLCQASSALICQIYAPLENSSYHRSFYIFACIQPACWNQVQSWKCFRGQAKTSSTTPTATEAISEIKDTFDWGSGDEDDWGDPDQEEDNSNSINEKMQNMALNEASTSHVEEDPNGNRVSPQPRGAIAMEQPSSDQASADVESDLIQEVIIETPDQDVIANNTLIPELFARAANNAGRTTGSLKPIYLAVDEETDWQQSYNADLSDHERQLLLEYKTKEAVDEMDHEETGAKRKGGKNSSSESYEKVAPRHGDVGFHKFLSVIQRNPGQVLRYCRDLRHQPLLMSLNMPKDLPRRCSYCSGPLSCEIQLLPTLIHSLKFDATAAPGDSSAQAHDAIEFGNLLVFTCYKSCWDDQLHYRREQLWLEAEPFSSFH